MSGGVGRFYIFIPFIFSVILEPRSLEITCMPHMRCLQTLESEFDFEIIAFLPSIYEDVGVVNWEGIPRVTE